MLGFSLDPNVYAVGDVVGLIRMLEQAWVRDQGPGVGTFYIISGFANFNGGVRFYEIFRKHVEKGGKIIAFFGGSASQRLTSRQVVEELLKLGAEVHVVNRKRILHAKLYGTSTSEGDRLVISSGNFTGPGMGQNIEGAVILDHATTSTMGFSWQNLVDAILKQSWQRHSLALNNQTSAGWKLLYDEFGSTVQIDDSQETTLVLTLSHADTARIQATRGTKASKGTQYFWLSKDIYGFFPPLTIRSAPEAKKTTFSCLVTMHYMDLEITDRNTRVTFEAENNLDFRLGTGPLRYSKKASEGDIAAITRIGENEYEMRIVPKDSNNFLLLSPFAINHIGNQGKQYGFIDNDQFATLMKLNIPDKTVNTFKVTTTNSSGSADDE